MTDMTLRRRAWLRLPSGAHLDLINPDPKAWTDQDLAIKLARVFRWGGESQWPLAMPVAQHCLLVLELRRQSGSPPATPALELAELLHDAEEAWLGFDCISPLKASLGEPFARLSADLMQAVHKRYDVPGWSADEHAQHKVADNTAAASEAVHVVGWTPTEVREVLGIAAPVLDVDPLAVRFNEIPWRPWSSEVAAARFLAELHQLLAARQQHAPTVRG